MEFCNDVDLMYWEPNLARDAAFASQTIGGGTGEANGNLFGTPGGVSFNTMRVEAGHILVLSGTISGCYAITAVGGPYILVISTIYTELFPETGSPPVSVGVPIATGLTYAVRTFWAQRKVVGDLIRQSLGITPGTADETTITILNTKALKRPCALGALQMIYSAMAAVAEEPGAYVARAEMYGTMFRRSMRQLRIELDTDGDGIADITRTPGLMRLVRE